MAHDYAPGCSLLIPIQVKKIIVGGEDPLALRWQHFNFPQKCGVYRFKVPVEQDLRWRIGEHGWVLGAGYWVLGAGYWVLVVAAQYPAARIQSLPIHFLFQGCDMR